MSYARIPKASTIDPHPNTLHMVTVSTASPKMMSDKNTSTIVNRLPTEATMGPHTPNRTCATDVSEPRPLYIRARERGRTMKPALNTEPVTAMPAITR